MNDYQIKILREFRQYLSKPVWKYPFYCDNNLQFSYLEEYFLKYFIEHRAKKDTFYIPVMWTSIYNNRTDPDVFNKVQESIDALNQNYRYFTVCTNDNAPVHRLPKGTINFSAGTCCDTQEHMIHSGATGDGRKNIPIPLICARIPENIKSRPSRKRYIASFAGRDTHPIRRALHSALATHNNYKIVLNSKSIFDCGSLSEEETREFVGLAESSVFSLCPRGTVSTSFRLYETMQLNSVPIYISDDFWLPWQSELDWESFCIFATESELPLLPTRLDREIRDGLVSKRNIIINNIYDKYFTLESVSRKILECIK